MIGVCIGNGPCTKESKAYFELFIKEIINAGCKIFYVGAHSKYEKMMLSVFRNMKKKYADIEYNVVLTTLPDENWQNERALCPKGIQHLNEKEALAARNDWLLFYADYIICHIEGNDSQYNAVLKDASKRKTELFNLFASAAA